MFEENTSALRDFQVKISTDGRRVVGKKVPASRMIETTTAAVAQVETPAETADEPKLVQIFDYASKSSQELLAQISEKAVEDYRHKAELYVRMANGASLNKTIIQRRLKKAAKRHAFWKKARTAQIVGTTLMGFILGVILAVSQLLEKHGPTVTLFGTIGACVIYLAAGILFGGFFGWLGKEQADEFISGAAEKVENLRKLIQEAKKDHDDLMAEAEKYAEMARDEQKRAWHYRGFC